jgi:tetratricopeptide (TPR) repeat protein
MQLSECYRLLGLARNASPEDVKLAYRRMARKYHPDVNQGDPAAADKFRLVQEAYQILKNVADGIMPAPQTCTSAPPTQSRTTQPKTSQQAAKPSPQPAAQSPQSQGASKANQKVEPKVEPKVTPKIKVEVKDVRQKQDPIGDDPEVRLKIDMLGRLMELLKQKKYVVAIAIAEGLRERYKNSPEVIHWQAVAYQRRGSELLMAGKLKEAEAYLTKAMNTDPGNRDLCFEVKRDLERIADGRV